jgi:DNA-binding response OmpR family regulator
VAASLAGGAPLLLREAGAAFRSASRTRSRRSFSPASCIHVIAEAGSVDDARSLAEIEGYDLAILDINLHGANVRPVAAVVRSRGLPLFFLSGYGSKGVPDGFEGTPVLLKPCTLDKLKHTIDAVLLNGESETSSSRQAL